MKCSYPECKMDAIKVCIIHHYAVCNSHKNKHTDICNEVLKDVELYQTMQRSSRNILINAYESSKMKVVDFSLELIKRINELTDSKLKYLKTAFQKESLNELQLDFRNEEIKYLTFAIEYIFKFKSFESQIMSSDRSQSLEGRTLKGLLDSNLSGFGEISYQNGAKYVGGLMTGEENGLGYKENPNGNKYFGENLKGFRSGIGIYIGGIDLRFEGFFCSGKQNGFGVLNTSDFRYEGNFENGNLQGLGEIRYKNGDSYEGEFLNSELTGYGKFISSDGNTYIGYLKNGAKHGKGKFIDNSGVTFEGEWVENQRHGRGKMTKTNGQILEGIWESDRFIN